VTYYWRVKAVDGNLESSWLTSSFKVNAVNEAPPKPALSYPDDGAVTGTTGPTLKALSVVDPDGDNVSYIFELCKNNGDCTVSDALSSPEWKLSGLVNNTMYQWSAKAVDEHGLAGESSDTWEFNVSVNSTPTPPRLNNPVSGGSIYSADLVILSVKNSTDEDGDALTYDFELYGDSVLSELIETGSSKEGALITEYDVQAELTEEKTYNWRARAYDGKNYSSYTSTFNFLYTAEEPVYKVDVVTSQVVYASMINGLADGNTYDISVDDSTSAINGVTVSLPKGALEENINLTIGTATATPSLPSGVSIAGKIIDLGPEGTVFATPITLKVPYTQDELTTLGLDDPAKLKLYTYGSSTGEWEILDASSVDTANMVAEFKVSHFSVFTFGVSTTGDSGTNNDSGGGLGGCFIATAAYGSYMEPHVLTLRQFRDKILMTNSLGQGFVKLYYRTSPPIADYIAKHDMLRMTVRWCLGPVVGFAWLALNMGPLCAALLGFIGLLTAAFGIVLLFRRNRAFVC